MDRLKEFRKKERKELTFDYRTCNEKERKQPSIFLVPKCESGERVLYSRLWKVV